MLNKSNQTTILIALATSAALIGFAFYQRYGTPIHHSSVIFFLFAATICVPRFVYGVLRCKSRVNKPSNIG